MTTVLVPEARAAVADGAVPVVQAPEKRWGWAPYLAALAVVVLRLPFLVSPARPDEAGFLTVAGQWHAGGTSLYGDYWVDRPPLLITVYRLASALGGLPALRLLGCVAAAVTVLAVSAAARRSSGRGAAGWSAVVVAALLVSPVMGALEVNGELLAAPFLAMGIACATEVVSQDAGRWRWWAAAGAGGCGVAAVLVKQNLADVAVFAFVTWFVAYRVRQVDGRDLLRAVLAAVSGGAVVLSLVAAWTLAHGTSLVGTFDAMYPFRIQAARAIAANSSSAAEGRIALLAGAWALSAVPLVVLAFGWLVLGRRLRGPVVWGLAAALAFSMSSILMGGSYWFHYLIEMVPVVAIAAGAVVSARPLWGRLVVAAVVTAATFAWATSLSVTPPSSGTGVGAAIGGSARPHDTVVSAFGNADIVLSSGLTSPYPYLWSLPSRVLDPSMSGLRAVMGGPAAPTWLVVRGAGTRARLRAAHVSVLISRDYRRVGEVCGRTVYLRQRVTRPALRSAGTCPSAPSAITSARDDLVRAVDGAS